MSIFKCKMCGGNLEITEGSSVATCEYCGSKQTLPRLDNDRRSNLYDRANHFRRNNEFDKAIGIYENILNEDNTDAEAYWSLVLCRYGIEYVEDPATHKRVPTVNRAQFTSVFDDEDYKSALQYATLDQRGVYEAEAAAINEIQKGILEISRKEDPFDVFICYKETDAQGRRTPDSVLANDLYHQLTQEGFKVFFSRITLEDKLGIAYEPYIFAALNSAKVMVVLGTRPEFFNAVWVKNEWSRYLSLIKNGAQKALVPAYRDMDPYDLPEEFSHLQAQDMSKLGFMQDLIRGIKKILSADAPKAAVIETVVQQSVPAANTAPLLERVFLFLEDGKWQDANIYCEKVLDIDPKNAEAYLGKLMAELQVKTRKQLADCAEPFDNRDNYSKVLRFGDEKLEAEMRCYIADINERIDTARLTDIYSGAVNAMNEATTEEACQSVAETFKSISGFKDATALAENCLEKAEQMKQERLAKEETDRLETKRKAEERRIAKEKAAKKRKKAFAIGTPIVTACIAFVILLNTVIIPKQKYNALVEEYGQELVDKLYSIDVGDTYTFGTYEQDNNTSNGKEAIEWTVLEKNGMSLLLVSKQALDCQQYNRSYTDVPWETCSLRKWMNGTFLNNAFSAEEQAQIQNTTVSTDKKSNYSTNPGNATTDKVFLLSITEAEKYFTSDSARQCKPTEYAVANEAYVNSDNGNCWWWLRSPGLIQNLAAFVNYNGSVDYYGHSVLIDIGAVRPALWINLGD